jgi:hypothetical protein
MTRSTLEPIDPDCQSGKHRACPGETWDDPRDQLTACACSCHTEPR